jgi:hypothetical protein
MSARREFCFHLPLKGEGRTAKRSGEGSPFDASMTPTRRAARVDFPFAGGGKEDR